MNTENSFLASTFTTSTPADRTQPERHIISPLTPPATVESGSKSDIQSPVSTVLNFVKERARGKLSDQSLQLKVTWLEYKNLLARLEELPELKEFVECRLRREYDGYREVLHIPRMLSATHELFLSLVRSETEAQLRSIASGGNEAARFAAEIIPMGHTDTFVQEFDSEDDIGTEGPYIVRQPDEQFQYGEEPYPGVVFEIARSENSGDLAKKAWDYIVLSDGEIKIVVGFELGYGKKKGARISIWQPKRYQESETSEQNLEVEAVLDGDLFRSSEGSAINSEKNIHIPLDCFAASSNTDFQGEGITIAYGKLAEILDKAERRQKCRHGQRGKKTG